MPVEADIPEPIVAKFAAEHFMLNSISPSRQAQVVIALRRLGAFLPGPLVEITDNQLRAWLASMLADGLMASTVGWYLRMVMPFYRWCWQQRLISADDYLRLREVSPPRGFNNHEPRPYSRKELTLFWEQLDARFPYLPPIKDGRHPFRRWRNGTSPFRSVKKHVMRTQLDAIIELALTCGLRRQEIYSLSIDDVHFDNKYIVVHGKRVDQHAKVREVPYPPSTREAVHAWLKLRLMLDPHTDCLWLSVTGPVPGEQMRFARFAQILCSFGEWELHRLRHTCATERLRAGMALEQLQRFLGHSRMEQTLAYAKLNRQDIHKASERIDAEFQRAIRPAA